MILPVGCTTLSKVLLILIAGVDCMPAVFDLNGLATMEVPYGGDVVIACRSNDQNHNFWYWNVPNKDIIISATNTDYDQSKFRFAILSGNLTVKSLSTSDEGIYSCVSQGIRENGISINKTRIVVLKDWEEVYDNDPTVNLFRIVIAIAILAILAMGSYLIYKIWRDRYRFPSYLQEVDNEEDDDDSAEELFRAPGPSRTTSKREGNIVLNKDDDLEFENPTISTDFTSILDRANDK
ncbi:unnamed protein product [Brassicogethes aeneus]|uniref:Ig-like domain-containing protein n=1 Tax=Brassicogethes aeneus TaxID=1431903 RepID=A0A9P0FLJ2_BRAAE|nr:unnamed protein product [Brassicogethes aeneus]